MTTRKPRTTRQRRPQRTAEKARRTASSTRRTQPISQRSAKKITRPRTKKQRSSSSRQNKSSSLAQVAWHWVKLTSVWLVVVLVLLYVAYRTLLPVLLNSSWLVSDAVEGTDVVLLTHPSQAGWLFVYTSDSNTKGGVAWIEEKDQFSTLSKNPLDTRILEGDIEQATLTMAQLQELDSETALVILNQATGLGLTKMVQIETEQWQPGSLREISDEIFSQLSSLFLQGQLQESIKWTRIWYVLRAERMAELSTVDQVVAVLRKQRLASTTFAPQNCQVAVLNGTDISGLSAGFTDLVEQQGISVVRVGQAEDLADKTIIEIEANMVETCSEVLILLRQFLPVGTQQQISSVAPSIYRAPIVLTLGEDVGASRDTER